MNDVPFDMTVAPQMNRTNQPRVCEDRAPFDMTRLSTVQVIRVCPRCRAGNRVSKTWFAGYCRSCEGLFNRDEALPESEMDGGVMVPVGNLIDTDKTAIKADMEERAYAYKDEQTQIAKDGVRNRSVKNPLRSHFDAEKFRQ